MNFIFSASTVEKEQSSFDQQQARLIMMLNGVQRGDVPAFKSLYSATSPQLFGILLQLLHDQTWAEQALHETFLLIWQRQKCYCSKDGSPQAWLVGLASEKAIGVLRVNRREKRRRIATEIRLNSIQDPK